MDSVFLVSKQISLQTGQRYAIEVFGLDASVLAMAQELDKAGFVFEVEVSSGVAEAVTVTCTDGKTVLSSRCYLADNNPIESGVKEIITEAYGYFRDMSREQGAEQP